MIKFIHNIANIRKSQLLWHHSNWCPCTAMHLVALWSIPLTAFRTFLVLWSAWSSCTILCCSTASEGGLIHLIFEVAPEEKIEWRKVRGRPWNCMPSAYHSVMEELMQPLSHYQGVMSCCSILHPPQSWYSPIWALTILRKKLWGYRCVGYS